MEKLACFSILVASIAIALIAIKLALRLPSNSKFDRTDGNLLVSHSRIADRVGSVTAGLSHELSAVLPVMEGKNAFDLLRSAIDAADRSIDAQYYIWQDDVTGTLLLDALRQAACRNVRVRLLIDDNGIDGAEPLLAELNRLKTVQVRLYNPFVLRRAKRLSYLFDFRRLNRRMHNKALIIDGSVAMVGGRNIGDDYFSYGDGAHFFDLDALLAGAICRDVADNFEAFWNSAPSYPAEIILSRLTPSSGGIQERARLAADRAKAAGYLGETDYAQFGQALDDLLADTNWQTASLISDTPEKTLNPRQASFVMSAEINRTLLSATRRADIVTAYFIPGRQGMATIQDLRSRGVQLRILTNSLATNDVTPVHGAYVRYRKEMLRKGVKLFELQPRPDDLPVDWSHYFDATSSLHGKTFAIDGQRVFIGSFNLDPRSASLNTEMGILFNDHELAHEIALTLERSIASWRLVLNEKGKTQWMEEGEIVSVGHEPDSSLLQRIGAWLPRILPIERWL